MCTFSDEEALSLIKTEPHQKDTVQQSILNLYICVSSITVYWEILMHVIIISDRKFIVNFYNLRFIVAF